MTTIPNNEFKGLADNLSPVAPVQEFHEEDQGSNHEQAGVWAVRRGMEHTGQLKKDSEILALAGFENANGDIVYASVAGTDFCDGELAPVLVEGFGEDGFGEGGFGE